MHLTNYAVNKHSDGFVQPSADSSSNNEGQDDASKRSLKWFMDWFKENYGEEKAKLIWDRMGTVIVRTVLSILPTLSREYDQHFKSFNNVPCSSGSKKGDGLSAASGGDKDTGRATSGSRGNRNSRGSSDHDEASEDVGEDNDEEDEDDDGEGEDEAGDNEDEDDDAGSVPRPNLRGSRCFEVLGLDIMIDKNLKAWLIEVNHLPSFGTDSPLDLDIKERLMNQVFKSLPVLPDDEEAYAQYHKEQAEKRLTGDSRFKVALAEKEKEKEEREKKDKERRRAANLALRAKAMVPPTPVIPQVVTIDRVDEIKLELIKIYEEYCPDKINKIDKLLAKYLNREEEFLQFVIEKYGVIQFKKSLSEPEPEPEHLVVDEQLTYDEPRKLEEDRSVPMLIPRPPNLKDQRQQIRVVLPNKRSSRSLSPEPVPSRRASAVWKGGPEDNIAFRNEILSQYVPKEVVSRRN